jgi:hypothetical protein
MSVILPAAGESFPLRGLEIHSHRIWDRASIERAVDFMTRLGLNALVFHQTDMIDALLLPDKYFGQALPLGQWPEFPILKTRLFQEDHRHYMNQVIRSAHARGIQVYFNIKEPWYPEVLLYVRPDLLDAKGQVCPSNPFWPEYVEAKVEQLLRDVPDVDGIIQSPGTIESKVSFSYSSCGCERCRATTFAAWMKSITVSLYRPLTAHGKRLIVRDFSYFPSDSDAIFDVMKDVPAEVAVSLKCAPHDFYPTFPQNPRIGHSEGHPQVVEFDVWGQYCGLGVFPCLLLDDIRGRVKYALARGAQGYIARTDWEIVTDGWALDCFSFINAYALQKLWEDPDYETRRIYREALELMVDVDLPFAGRIRVESERDLDGLAGILARTWPILSKSLYIHNHMFQGNSMGAVVDSLREARYTTVEHHSLSIWDESQPDVFKHLDAAMVEALLAEKEEALVEIRDIVTRLRGGHAGLNPRLNRAMLTLCEAFELYVRQFHRAGRAYILTEYALATGAAADTARASAEVYQLDAVEAELEAFRPAYLYEPQSNITAMLLNPRRTASLRRSLAAALAGENDGRR